MHSYTCSFVYFGFTGSGVGAEVVLVVVLFAVSLFFYYSASLLRIVSNLYSKFYALLDASNFMLRRGDNAEFFKVQQFSSKSTNSENIKQQRAFDAAAENSNPGRTIQSTPLFVCDNGRKTDAIFGDDFCDCMDGSDEINTDACSNLLVHKRVFKCDEGGKHEIFTSRVNDLICDCKDGSDEYNTSADCRKKRP